jgi:spermidine/putrescine transport system permease protein
VSAAAAPAVAVEQRPRALVSDRVIDGALRGHAALVFVFLYAPILVVVIFAFNENRYAATWTNPSLRWFGITFGDETIRQSFFLSAWTAAVNAVIATVIGSAAALGLRNIGRRARTVFDSFVYTNLVIPEIVIAIASLLFFSTVGFPLGAWAIVLTHSLFNVSIVTLVVRARLAGMDRSLEEASADLGGTRWGTFQQVTLPQLFPAIMAGALLAFTFSFDDVVLSTFVTGPGSTTLPLRVFSEVRFGLTPRINVVAVFILALTLTAILIANLLLRRTGSTALPAGDTLIAKEP